jgi:lysozyme family protein
MSANFIAQSYPAAFIGALGRVLQDEGSLSDNPGDEGGETKYGISQRQYPSLNIAALTIADAAAIYYRDWWTRFNFGALPGPIGAKAFDLAVNMGPRSAIICLQRATRACGHAVPEDGDIGPITISAASAADAAALLAAFRSEAAAYYRLLTDGGNAADSNSKFLTGWLNRAYE